jgi:hypothetical protein
MGCPSCVGSAFSPRANPCVRWYAKESMEQSGTQSFVFALAVFGVFCASTAAQTVKENSPPAAVQGKVVPGSAQVEGKNASEGKGGFRKSAGTSEPLPPKVENPSPATMDQTGKPESVKESRLVTRPVPPEPKALTRNPVAPTPTVRTPSSAPTTNADQPAAHPAPQA